MDDLFNTSIMLSNDVKKCVGINATVKTSIRNIKKANDSLIQTHHWNVKWNDYGLFILRCDKCSTELTVCTMDMSFTSVDNIVVTLGPFKYCLSWIMCSCGEAVMKKALST